MNSTWYSVFATIWAIITILFLVWGTETKAIFFLILAVYHSIMAELGTKK